MKTILVAMGLLFLCNCTSIPKLNEVPKTYDKAASDFDFYTGFAFELDGHQYYFSSVFVEENEHRCQFIIGYKDNQRTYQFPFENMQSLHALYKAPIDMTQKMKKALEKIENFSLFNLSCNSQYGYKVKKDSALETTLTFMVYGPMIPLGVIFGAEVIAKSINEELLLKKMRGLRLGLSPEQVVAHIKYPMHESKWPITQSEEAPYTYQEIQSERRKLIFVYKNRRLVAFVWGS